MGKSLRVAYGEALVKLGAKNEKVVALDADLAHATMSATFAADCLRQYRCLHSPTAGHSR